MTVTNQDAARLGADDLPGYVDRLPDWPWRGRPVTFTRITSGLTNVNWRMTEMGSGTNYFFKVPGEGTRRFIDRKVANIAASVAAENGVSPQVLYFDEESGVEVTEFLEGYTSSSLYTLGTLERGTQLMTLYRRLHEGLPLPVTKTIFDMIDEHIAQVEASGRVLRPWQAELIDEWLPVQQAYLAAGVDLVPGHNDMLPSNYMVKEGAEMMLIDYDYAANTERAYEPGGIMTLYLLDDAVREAMLEAYFGEVTERDRARVKVCGIATDVKWGLWGLVNATVRGTEDFDFEKYGTMLLMHARQLMTELDMEALVEAL